MSESESSLEVADSVSQDDGASAGRFVVQVCNNPLDASRLWEDVKAGFSLTADGDKWATENLGDGDVYRVVRCSGLPRRVLVTQVRSVSSEEVLP